MDLTEFCVILSKFDRTTLMEFVFENQETKTGVFLIRDSIHWHEESNTYTADFFLGVINSNLD